jgi:hypothetical protein
MGRSLFPESEIQYVGVIMDVFYAIGLNLIIISGILTALTVLTIFLSCRCFPVWKPVSGLLKNEKYKSFFKRHCNFWWLFWSLIIIHVTLVTLYFFD